MLVWTSFHAGVDGSTVLQFWKHSTVFFIPKNTNDKNKFSRSELWTFFPDVPQMSQMSRTQDHLMETRR